MQFSPAEDEAEFATAECAVHHREVVDPYLRLALPVTGVEMRMAMVVASADRRRPHPVAEEGDAIRFDASSGHRSIDTDEGA